MMRGSVHSMCPTLERTVGVSGHLVLCWGAVDRGCRQMVVHHTEKGWYDPPPCLGNPGDTCTPATTCLP
jgi:hypothetical protein